MRIPIFGVLLAIELCTSLPASAEMVQTSQPCHLYGEIRRQLDAGYGEVVISSGLQTDGSLLQVFASSHAETWTIVSTAPSGLACIVAAGRGWNGLDAPVPAAGPGA